jgi:hypothetical protein
MRKLMKVEFYAKIVFVNGSTLDQLYFIEFNSEASQRIRNASGH